MREKKANDFKPKITQKSRDMVHKRMKECTFQSASQMKKVQLESLSSTLLSNMAADKNGHKRRNNTTESVEQMLQASQTCYSIKNLTKKAHHKENDENLSNEEVGGQGILRSLATHDNLPKNIIVPSQIDLLYQDAI